MANAERLMLLADSLGKVADFDMVACLERGDCGTRACIAGHAVLLSGKPIPDYDSQVMEDAQDWLGLTDAERTKLFVPWAATSAYKGYRRYLISAEQAAEVVRNFASTGEIVWP